MIGMGGSFCGQKCNEIVTRAAVWSYQASMPLVYVRQWRPNALLQ